MVSLNLDDLRRFRFELLTRVQTEKNVDKIQQLLDSTIIIDPRMRTRAGTANFSRNTIKLNQALLTRHPEHIEQTFAHELAHLIAYALYGHLGRGHGRFWQSVMRQLGFTPDRTHDMDCSGLERKHKPVAVAKCGCQLHQLKRRKFNKIMRGARYRCLSCRTQLTIVGVENE